MGAECVGECSRWSDGARAGRARSPRQAKNTIKCLSRERRRRGSTHAQRRLAENVRVAEDQKVPGARLGGELQQRMGTALGSAKGETAASRTPLSYRWLSVGGPQQPPTGRRRNCLHGCLLAALKVALLAFLRSNSPSFVAPRRNCSPLCPVPNAISPRAGLPIFFTMKTSRRASPLLAATGRPVWWWSRWPIYLPGR